jgi:hypothetical protein
MENKIKRIIAILLAVCFVVSLTAMAASAQKHPVISNEGNNDPIIGNAVSNEHVNSGSDCTNGSGSCPWRNLNPNDNSPDDPYTSP